jgi:hypothetical protein
MLLGWAAVLWVWSSSLPAALPLAVAGVAGLGIALLSQRGPRPGTDPRSERGFSTPALALGVTLLLLGTVAGVWPVLVGGAMTAAAAVVAGARRL